MAEDLMAALAKEVRFDEKGKLFRLGVVTNINELANPPLISVDGRQMRIVGSPLSFSLGDTAIWVSEGATAWCLGRLSNEGDGVWYSPAMFAPFVVFGGTTYYQHAYRRVPNNEVQLRGLVKSTSANANRTIFTLPIGFRPVRQTILNAWGNSNGRSAVLRIDVHVDGNVIIMECDPGQTITGPWSFISLDNLSFSLT